MGFISIDERCQDCGASDAACICGLGYDIPPPVACTCGGGLDGVHEPGCGETPETPETYVPTPLEMWEYETEQNPLLLPHWGWRALKEWWDFQDMGGSPVLDIPAWAWNPNDRDDVPF